VISSASLCMKWKVLLDICYVYEILKIMCITFNNLYISTLEQLWKQTNVENRRTQNAFLFVELPFFLSGAKPHFFRLFFKKISIEVHRVRYFSLKMFNLSSRGQEL
jgi:hypothetical protein